MPGMDDPTCHDCVIAQALRDALADREHEIAVLKGLTRLPGAVHAAHANGDDRANTD